jgi:hypothetical protein
MPSKTTLTAKNLEALGAERLAELLLEMSDGDAAAKRRLRLALAGSGTAAAISKEVRKRLAAIGRARSFIDWQNRKPFAADLDLQRRMIATEIAATDPSEAYELLWQFLGLAEAVFNRCDDSSGTITGIFHQAVANLGAIAAAAGVIPTALADRMFGALFDNGYGQFDPLIETLAPALGQEGLAHLKTQLEALAGKKPKRPADAERQKIGWSSSGPIYRDDIEDSASESTIRYALMEIADALGDVDGFMAQYDKATRKVPRIAAEIANRLTAAVRAAEALAILDAADHPKRQPEFIDLFAPDFEWDDARIAALEALERKEEVQAMRLACFERHLSANHLRAYLKRLPDFEDIEAEERALDLAATHQNALLALSFFITWPALDRAAKLILARTKDMDGDRYEVLTPSAEALAAKHPLAATVLLRAMIGFALEAARSSRYKHAARHLADCAGLAARIEDFAGLPDHAAYAADLKRAHGRKSGFWGLVKE